MTNDDIIELRDVTYQEAIVMTMRDMATYLTGEFGRKVRELLADEYSAVVTKGVELRKKMMARDE